MFFIKIYKDSGKVKINRNVVSKYNLYLYFLIWQNLLISGEKILTSGEFKGCVTWLIYFLDLLWVRYNWAKFHHCRIYVTDFRKGGRFCPTHPWAAPKKPILNRVQRINRFLFPLKSSENHMFSDDFMAKRSHGKKSLIQSRFKSGLRVFFAFFRK